MYDKLLTLVEKLVAAAWGTPTVLLLLFCGVFFTFLLKFFQLTKAKLWLKSTLFSLFKPDVRRSGERKGVSQFQALSTALAATIGTGNIAGVATAITAGGPGAVFWMWVSAFFGMMTSFAENSLGIKYRTVSSSSVPVGGPMYYMKNGLESTKAKKLAAPFAAIYSVFLMGACIGIGNMVQANSISNSAEDVFGISKPLVGIVLTVLTAFVIAGGVERIGKVTEKLVPFMALSYILCALTVFALNYKSIPYVFGSIFQNAFSFRSVSSGAAGVMMKKCVSMGFRRGIFSNEAGLGASVTVSSTSNVKEPVKQGMWGIFQVFTDTMIVCTMTAFIILSSSVNALPLEKALEKIESGSSCVYLSEGQNEKRIMLADINSNSVFERTELAKAKEYTVKSKEGSFKIKIQKGNRQTFANVMLVSPVKSADGKIVDITLKTVDGVSLVALALSQRFGQFASVMLCVAIVLFAFSTIIGWSFYGTRATQYLFGEKGIKAYKLFYIAFVFVGSVTKLDLVWGISDVLNALMAVPNVVTLIILSPRVKEMTNAFLRQKQGGKEGGS